MHTHAARLVDASGEVDMSGQAEHAPWSLCPVAALYVPLGHAISLPAEHQKPCEQLRHSLALRKPEALPTVPAGHGVGEELPFAHHAKTVHGSQNTAPGSA